MKRRLYLLLLSAALLFGLSACGPGPHVHMYGGMDSHGGPYYGAGWDYDSHHHGKKHKKHKKKKKYKYKKHHKTCRHHDHHDD